MADIKHTSTQELALNNGYALPDAPEQREHFILNEVSPDSKESQRDINKPELVRIGKYLSGITQAKAGFGSSTHSNTIPIKGNVTFVTSVGPLTEIEKEHTYYARSEGYIEGVVPVTSTEYNSIKIQDPLISVQGETGTNISYDELSRIRGVDPQGPIPKDQPAFSSKYVSAVLSNNRFSPSNKLSENPKKPKKDFNPSMRLKDGTVVTMEKLAHVGAGLSIRGSVEFGSKQGTFDPTDAAAELGAILPSLNQLAVARADWENLTAQDVLDSLGSGNKSLKEGEYFSIGEKSWGALNNVYDHYSGLGALGMTALSLALVASVTVLFEGLGVLLSLIKSDGGQAPTVDHKGKYMMGKWHVQTSSGRKGILPQIPPDMSKLLGIKKTTAPFGEALRKGTAVFFGLDDSGGVLGQIGSALQNSIKAPGSVAVTCRAILRSSITIVDSFKDLFSSPNFISAVNNVFDVVEVLKSSKLIAAVNVFSQLGDLAITYENNVEPETDGDESYSSDVDRLDDDVFASSVRKHRLNNALKLAYASNRSASMVLVPTTIVNMQSVLGNLGAPVSVYGDSGRLSKQQQKLIKPTKQALEAVSSRLTSDDVKNIENALEAEYVPFYFHDIRTNEIIGFHAFLDSLTDSYSSEFDSGEGVGRIDPVHIYKKTTRSITFTFNVISTSEEDFSEMWQKINKLTTLVYPQYTAGNWLVHEDSNYAFRQPFSQLVSASPLIRLRIGDVIKTNYSRFDLARLFGVADPGGVALGDAAGTKFDSQTLNEKYVTELKKALSDPSSGPNQKYTYVLTSTVAATKSGGEFKISLPMLGGSNSEDHADNLTKVVDANDIKYLSLKAVSKPSDLTGMAAYRVQIMTTIEITTNYNWNASIAKKIHDHMANKYRSKKKNKKSYVDGGIYLIPNDNVTLTAKDKKDILTRISAGQTSNYGIDALFAFMDPKNNSIVRAFEQTGGKGLPGVITSLSFADMISTFPWETSVGSRAPKGLKITVNYSPVHDISPGIDHLGYNRAPIYQVGYDERQLDRGNKE
jgi:hypothetical protein